MKPDLVEKATTEAVVMLQKQLEDKAPEIAEAIMRHESTLDEETREFTFTINGGIKLAINRDKLDEIKVKANANWSTKEVIVTGTATVSTQPELPLGDKQDAESAETAEVPEAEPATA